VLWVLVEEERGSVCGIVLFFTLLEKPMWSFGCELLRLL
jgi:hypothetical protein